MVRPIRGCRYTESTDNPPCFHRVLRCLGWQYDESLLAVTRDSTGKFPKISGEHESRSHKGVFFVGALGHSLDYRKSSGGFIHGFRYTARAVYRGLRERLHHEEWPHTLIPAVITAQPMVDVMLRRINRMAGPYQMFNHLMEVFVVGTDRNTVHYQEVPKPAFKKFMKRRRDFRPAGAVAGVFTLRFVYGTKWSQPGHNVFALDRVANPSPMDEDGPGKDNNFIHPLIEFYSDAGTKIARPKSMHHMIEEVTTFWGLESHHI